MSTPRNPILAISRPANAPIATPPAAPPSIYESNPHLIGLDLAGELPVRADSTGLKDIDVAYELEHAFRMAKSLLDACVHDADTPLNQKAQIIGALNTVLTAMVKQRTDIYSAERVRTLEGVLLKVLKRHPELSEEFLADYKTELEKLGPGK